jgi:type IV pilus assembly protein PilP
MRLLWLVPIAILLAGCFDDMSDLHEFENEVKSAVRPRVEPLPEITDFEHVAYRGSTSRSPFAMPVAEALQQQFVQQQDCLHPDPRRRKEPLEVFALDNLAMRGTLGDAGNLWALIQASDQTLHRITIDNHVGLYHGRVVAVAPTHIELLELIPDGAGCWKERTTMLQMVESVN